MKSNMALVWASIIYIFLKELFTFKKRTNINMVEKRIRTISITKEVLKYMNRSNEV